MLQMNKNSLSSLPVGWWLSSRIFAYHASDSGSIPGRFNRFVTIPRRQITVIIPRVSVDNFMAGNPTQKNPISNRNRHQHESVVVFCPMRRQTREGIRSKISLLLCDKSSTLRIPLEMYPTDIFVENKLEKWRQISKPNLLY